MKKLLVLLLILSVAAAFVYAQEAEKKATAEAKTPTAEIKAQIGTANQAKQVGEIAVTTLHTRSCATVFVKAADVAPKEGYKSGQEGLDQAYVKMVSDGFMTLGMWMAENKLTANGPPFAIYFENPKNVKSPNELTTKVGFPVAADVKGSDVVKVETFPEHLAAVVQYEGPYDQAGPIWNALEKWLLEKGYVVSGAPSEVYLRGMNETKNPAEFLTEIRQPVTKADVKTEKVIKQELKEEKKEVKENKEKAKEIKK